MTLLDLCNRLLAGESVVCQMSQKDAAWRASQRTTGYTAYQFHAKPETYGTRVWPIDFAASIAQEMGEFTAKSLQRRTKFRHDTTLAHFSIWRKRGLIEFVGYQHVKGGKVKVWRWKP